LVVTATGVGVAALLIGWGLGGVGGSPAPSAGGAATTGAAQTTLAPDVGPVSTISAGEFPAATSEPTSLTEPTLPPEEFDDVASAVDASSPTVPPPAGWIDERFTPPAGLGPIDASIVLQSDDGDLVEIDLGTGTMRRAIVGEPGAFLYSTTIMAGADWTVLPQGNFESVDVVGSDGTSTEVSLDQFGDLVQVPGSDEIWRVLGNESTGGYTVDSLRFDGTPGERSSFEIPAGWLPVGGDPAGGVLVFNRNNAGGFFAIGPDGSERLTTGMLLALSADAAAVFECGATIDSCGVNAVDRATGERTLVPTGLGLGNLQPMVTRAGGLVQATLSPLGTVAVMSREIDSRQTVGILSLTDGSFVDLDASLDGSPVAWSDDGRYVIHLHQRKLAVFDIETGEDHTVATPDDLSFQDFALRPAG
jgi:hypothetical protein